MSSCSIAFTRPCPCGGRTSHENNARTAVHEASKKHQRFIQSQTQTTPKTGASSASSSPSTSSTAGKAC